MPFRIMPIIARLVVVAALLFTAMSTWTLPEVMAASYDTPVQVSLNFGESSSFGFKSMFVPMRLNLSTTRFVKKAVVDPASSFSPVQVSDFQQRAIRNEVQSIFFDSGVSNLRIRGSYGSFGEGSHFGEDIEVYFGEVPQELANVGGVPFGVAEQMAGSPPLSCSRKKRSRIFL